LIIFRLVKKNIVQSSCHLFLIVTNNAANGNKQSKMVQELNQLKIVDDFTIAIYNEKLQGR